VSAVPTRVSEQLVDAFDRRMSYLRVSLLDACNMRCVYCMPASGIAFHKQETLMSLSEILRSLRVAATLGVNKVRFTGGEPLLRSDVIEILSGAINIPGIERVYLTTNGLLLGQHVEALVRLGLNGVNVSLDSQNPKVFEAITRRKGFNTVMDAIEAAIASGIPEVKINAILLGRRNEDELLDFVRLAERLPVTVRLIELMPFDAGQIWAEGPTGTAETVRARLGQAGIVLQPMEGASTEVWSATVGKGRIAVIPSYSRTLCGACNRLRLTADGRLRNCLYSDQELDLLSLIRSGASDDVLAETFRASVAAKRVDGWTAQRENAKNPRLRISMTQIGG
jgi:GTP 3',8-cyclase